MRRVGQGGKRDANGEGIRGALEAVGARVTPMSGKGAPDLLVLFRGELYAFEVKSKNGDRTKAQEQTQWPIVRTEDEALRVIGAIVGPSKGPLHICHQPGFNAKLHHC